MSQIETADQRRCHCTQRIQGGNYSHFLFAGLRIGICQGRQRNILQGTDTHADDENTGEKCCRAPCHNQEGTAKKLDKEKRAIYFLFAAAVCNRPEDQRRDKPGDQLDRSKDPHRAVFKLIARPDVQEARLIASGFKTVHKNSQRKESRQKHI